MSNDKAIVFKETTANGTDSVTVKAPASVTTSYTLSLPPAVASAPGQVLTDVNANGVLTWEGAVGATVSREDYVVGTALNNYTGSTTVFNLVTPYTVAGKTLVVALDGDIQTLGATIDYLETNSTTVTFNNALISGQKVSFISSVPAASASGIVNSGTTGQVAYYASNAATVSGDANLTVSGGELIVTQPTSLAKVITLNDSTDSQKAFLAQNSGATNSYLYVGVNRDPSTGTYVQTGQGSAVIQIQSENNSGQVIIKSANTNNATPTQAAQFSESGCQIKGTTTNNSAASGFVGEYIESVVSTTNFPSTTVMGDLTSISLTAGDWDVTAIIDTFRNGATWLDIEGGITSTSGNSSTGRVIGSNWWEIAGTLSSIDYISGSVPSYRVSVSTTTTYYLKYIAVYTVATPTARGRLSARRVR
jgi:hypothetical protein